MAHILVIDDSRLVVRFVQHALAQDGHTVRALDSFIQLAATIRDDPPDAILLDLNIPALSGISMGKVVRAYQARELPIVIYSSAPCGELEAAAAELGARAYVQKSDDPAELRRTLKRVLPAMRAAGG